MLVRILLAVLASLLSQHAKPNAAEPDFLIGRLQKTYAIERPMRIFIRNKAGTDGDAYLRLEDLTTIYTDVVIDDIFDDGSDNVGHGFRKLHAISVPGGSTVSVIWKPLAQQKVYSPKVGRTYRLSLYTVGTLAGGGPVRYSGKFRFVRHGSQRIKTKRAPTRDTYIASPSPNRARILG